jgi:excisionase family DNA binding protein
LAQPDRADPAVDFVETQIVAVRGKTPFNAPFNILTALYSLTRSLSVEEVAEMFGKSPDTVYRMAQKRQIPSFMFGGSRCFDPSELAHWLIKKEPPLAAAAQYFQQAA